MGTLGGRLHRFHLLLTVWSVRTARVHLPEMVVRKKNYIGRSTWADPDLNGKVENFQFDCMCPQRAVQRPDAGGVLPLPQHI